LAWKMQQKAAIVAFMIVVRGAAPADAAPPQCTMEQATATLGSRLPAIVARSGLPGASLAFGANDARWAAAAGYASLELQAPVTIQTKFRVGSVSKVLTNAALLRLVQTGRLRLDGTVGYYMPEVPDHIKPITIRQLASHLGGIRHAVSADAGIGVGQTWERGLVVGYPDTRSAVATFIDDELVSPPGERYHYSSYAWTLISEILARVSRKPFTTLMTEEVTGPLALADTLPDFADVAIPGRASFYELEGKGPAPAAPVNMSAIWAAGGYLSTPTDLVDFALSHHPGAYFSAATLREMRTLQKARTGPSEYGIGWVLGLQSFVDEALLPTATPEQKVRIKSIYARLPVVEQHSGSARGSVALLVHAPAEKVAMAFAINANGDVGPAYTDVFIEAMEAFLVLAGRGPCAR
jgi:serine beta-lactamase-like protein LACTB, mitochondrial